MTHQDALPYLYKVYIEVMPSQDGNYTVFCILFYSISYACTFTNYDW